MNNDKIKLYELCLIKIKETDEISFKLMGLVPLLSGVSIYNLFTQDAIQINHKTIIIPDLVFWITGIFGALITFFIYCWEKRNIQTCNEFKNKAKELEYELDVGFIRVYQAIDNDTPKLFRMRFGKTEAEIAIYFLTIVFWLLLPVMKTFVPK